MVMPRWGYLVTVGVGGCGPVMVAVRVLARVSPLWVQIEAVVLQAGWGWRVMVMSPVVWGRRVMFQPWLLVLMIRLALSTVAPVARRITSRRFL